LDAFSDFSLPLGLRQYRHERPAQLGDPFVPVVQVQTDRSVPRNGSSSQGPNGRTSTLGFCPSLYVGRPLDCLQPAVKILFAAFENDTLVDPETLRDRGSGLDLSWLGGTISISLSSDEHLHHLLHLLLLRLLQLLLGLLLCLLLLVLFLLQRLLGLLLLLLGSHSRGQGGQSSNEILSHFN
jgi:hypothetical protein